MMQVDALGHGGNGRSRRFAAVLLLCGLCALPACAAESVVDRASPVPPTRSLPPSPPASRTPAGTRPPPRPSTTTAPTRIAVPYRVEVRVPDVSSPDFTATVRATLEDPRGWTGAGFELVESPDATNVIVLAEGADVDALCLPYETYGAYSCQNGPVVALNADRWRVATPEWTGDLATYRQMLINHEVGHLLGQRHVECTKPGSLAAVMVQQSTELKGCLPNAWPLPEEISVAARHDQPIAPGPGE